MTDEELRQAIGELNDAETEQEPICPDCTEKVLYECVACSSSNYPPKEQPAQEPLIQWLDIAADIAITEKNIALIRAEMQQEKRDAELRVCVKEFFEKYLNRTEESDGGKMFNPIVVSCCRALMTEPLNNLLAKMSELSGAAPKENIYD